MKRILSVMMNNKLLVIVIKKQVTNTWQWKFPLCFCCHWSPRVTLVSGLMTGPPVTGSPRVLTVHVSRVWSSSHPGTALLVTSWWRTSCMAAAPPVSSEYLFAYSAIKFPSKSSFLWPLGSQILYKLLKTSRSVRSTRSGELPSNKKLIILTKFSVLT